MNQTVFTNYEPCIIALTIEANGEISFSGECTELGTKYFLKEKKINGIESIKFYMPLTPENLKITICNDGKSTFDIKTIQKEPLENTKPEISKEIYDFCKHIFEFCQKYKMLGYGIYTDSAGMFPINLVWEIKSKTKTPATISGSGDIEISRKEFEKCTVPMQIFILLCLRASLELQTDDKLQWDLLAIQWYLGFGFPPTEAIFAITKICVSTENNVKRAENLYNYIENYFKKNIE